MAARRRSRKRPLTELAARSLAHALLAGLVRLLLLVLLSAAVYFLIVQVVAPGFADTFVETWRNRR